MGEIVIFFDRFPAIFRIILMQYRCTGMTYDNVHLTNARLLNSGWSRPPLMHTGGPSFARGARDPALRYSRRPFGNHDVPTHLWVHTRTYPMSIDVFVNIHNIHVKLPSPYVTANFLIRVRQWAREVKRQNAAFSPLAAVPVHRIPLASHIGLSDGRGFGGRPRGSDNDKTEELALYSSDPRGCVWIQQRLTFIPYTLLVSMGSGGRSHPETQEHSELYDESLLPRGCSSCTGQRFLDPVVVSINHSLVPLASVALNENIVFTLRHASISGRTLKRHLDQIRPTSVKKVRFGDEPPPPENPNASTPLQVPTVQLPTPAPMIFPDPRPPTTTPIPPPPAPPELRRSTRRSTAARGCVFFVRVSCLVLKQSDGDEEVERNIAKRAGRAFLDNRTGDKAKTRCGGELPRKRIIKGEKNKGAKLVIWCVQGYLICRQPGSAVQAAVDPHQSNRTAADRQSLSISVVKMNTTSCLGTIQKTLFGKVDYEFPFPNISNLYRPLGFKSIVTGRVQRLFIKEISPRLVRELNIKEHTLRPDYPSNRHSSSGPAHPMQLFQNKRCKPIASATSMRLEQNCCPHMACGISCVNSVLAGRCNRDKPPCKYFHPPQHLKDQLLINGRNHLALKNAVMQQMGLTPGQPVVPGQVPTAVAATTTYLAGVPQIGSTFSPYFSPGPIMPLTVAPDPTGSLSMVQQSVVAQQKMPRTDRLEFPGMVPYKRAAGDKSGVPMYQPASATYQQLLHQPFVPVS
ncbi:unnamed protein product, partial [Nesidiocoris tenuis]